MAGKALKRKVYEDFGLKCDFTGRTNKRFYDILDDDKVVGYLDINSKKKYECSVNLFENNNSKEFNERFFQFISQITIDNGISIKIINRGSPDIIRKFNKNSYVSGDTLHSVKYRLPDNVQGDFSLVSYNENLHYYNDNFLLIHEEKVKQLIEYGANIIKYSNFHICDIKSDASQKDTIRGSGKLLIRKNDDFKNSKMAPRYCNTTYVNLNVSPDVDTNDYISLPDFKEEIPKRQDIKRSIVISSTRLIPIDISTVNPDNKTLLKNVCISALDLGIDKQQLKDIKELQEVVRFIYDTVKTGHDDVPYYFGSFSELIKHYPHIEKQTKELIGIKGKSEIMRICEEISEIHNFPLNKKNHELINSFDN